MMSTRIVQISAENPDPRVLGDATDLIRTGKLVAFPTETVYGLGADAFNGKAVAAVFRSKGRPASNPLIVHIASLEQLSELTPSISKKTELLAKRFWPGPITLVVKRSAVVPDIVAAGLETVAVRIPDHAVPLELINLLQRPIVGPSANLSGKPSPTTAQHVYDDLSGRVDMILDAGPTEIGVESTVVDTTTEPATILRLGGVTIEQLQSAAGEIQIETDPTKLRRSPGTHYRHYAPAAQVILIERGNSDRARELFDFYRNQGKRVAGIFHRITPDLIANQPACYYLSDNLQIFSREFFSALRLADRSGPDIILVESVDETGIGITIMDRLRRAAETRA